MGVSWRTMEKAKEEFLNRFGRDYGYPDGPKSVDEIRATEFKRLEGTVYLDHAGATFYSEAQLEEVFKELSLNIYGNPHSQSDASKATSDIISTARQQVLDYFNASPNDYKCIFTSGATSALKLVGEVFPWSSESCYMYTMENHNSVLGIREYALDHGATVLAVDVEEVELQNGPSGNRESSIQILKRSVQRRVDAKFNQESRNGSVYNLFAFPSECNFSGVKFPLDLVNIIKDDAGKVLDGLQHCRGFWMVIIDAAKGCATEPPDLARYPADFVVFSFYKIFGYPTGLGALLVRNEAARLLNKSYFSGGTVSTSIADIDFVVRRKSTEQLLEDGTSNFLNIASIRHGFKIISALTTSAIARHTASLATYVRNVLVDLKHENGEDACIIYGREIAKVKSVEMGPTIAFNLKRADGSWVGYREVEKLASLSGIQLRTGCFCNPGACAKYLGLSHKDLRSNIEAGHVCWDDHDVLCGKPTGAVRISFGYMSTFEDAEKLLKFIVDSFLRKSNFSGNEHSLRIKSLPFSGFEGSNFPQHVHLKSITIYPVKSCAGFSVSSWPLSHIGLQYDREWLLKGLNDEILTQKRVPALCHIHPFIDLQQGKLHLESPYCKESLLISLYENPTCHMKEEMDVYGQRYEVQGYDSKVNKWFMEAIARPCTLVRCLSSQNGFSVNKRGREGLCRDIQSKLNFVNEAQLLLISEESVGDLNSRLNSNTQKEISVSTKPELVDVMRFRPNLVISGGVPYAEDIWRSLYIGKANFVSLGGCSRCQMINLDQSGQAQKSKEPLATLAKYRRLKGKILFGILLRYDQSIDKDGEQDDTKTWLHVGQEVIPS